MSEPRIVAVRPVDDDNQVVRVEGGAWAFRPRPCAQCPWRVDQTGSFPAEAFRISATTACDMAEATFACHMAGTKQPATCAGALLSSGAEHNMKVRMKLLHGVFRWDDVTDGGLELYGSYREMATANGVDPDDPALRGCR